MKPLLINGDWIETGLATPNVNPSDLDDVIDTHAQAGVAETRQAVAAAKAATLAWAQSPISQRHEILRLTSDELRSRVNELGELLAREEGKTLAEGKAEVLRASQIFDFFSGETLRMTGDVVDSLRPGVSIETTLEPIGVVGLITPWNFPMAIPAWKIAPALCHGNTIVFKPAELVPGCAWALAEILHRSGLPQGVLNLVTGPGSTAGQTLLDDPDVNGISFTGSVETGRRVAEACLSHMRKFQLEMGGKNPLVVLDDCDLETALDCAVDGAFYSTGQRCTASSRLIVTEGIHNRFVEALADRMRNLRVGHALHPDTQIGPVVDETQFEQDLRYIDIGRNQGGNLRTGGSPVTRDTRGYYLEPALMVDTTNDMRINQEEVFGPIASVIRVRDYEEALAVANDTEFGLSSGICTTSLKHASHFRRHAQAGLVMVNLPTAGVDPHVSFGGRKGSSFGPREQGRYARDFYTEAKTAYTRP